MDYQQQYQKKKGPWEGALSLVRSNDTILAAMYGCEPVHFLQNLHTIADRVDHVTLWSMMVMGHYPVKYDTSLKGKIDIISYFYNDACRKGHDGAFAYGDRSLYQNMKESPGLQMRRARYVNDPFVIAQNDNMVSVNAAIEIDLTGRSAQKASARVSSPKPAVQRILHTVHSTPKVVEGSLRCPAQQKPVPFQKSLQS